MVHLIDGTKASNMDMTTSFFYFKAINLSNGRQLRLKMQVNDITAAKIK